MEKRRMGFFMGSFFSAVAVLTICIALLPFGHAIAAEKPEFINVVLIGDFTGPYAASEGQAKPGGEDAWQYINEELGGVHGVPVKLTVRDMSGKVALGLSMYNEAINMKPKPVFIDADVTPLSQALRQRYIEDDVVGFHPPSIPTLYPQGNSYAIWPLYREQAAIALKWVKDTWKEKRNPRVAILTWDTAYGRSIISDELSGYLKKIGVDLVGTQLFGIRDVDVTVQLMKLRSKKPDYILTNTTCNGPVVIKKGMKEMGWKCPIIVPTGLDWGTYGLDHELFEGDIDILHIKSFDETEDPAVKTLMTYFNKNNRTVKDKGVFYMVGWASALIEHKIMTEIVDELGWEGLTTKNIVKKMNSLTDFKPLGGLTSITFTETRRSPCVARVYRTTGGKLVPLSDFMETPDLMPAKYK